MKNQITRESWSIRDWAKFKMSKSASSVESVEMNFDGHRTRSLWTLKAGCDPGRGYQLDDAVLTMLNATTPLFIVVNNIQQILHSSL
jgi:hypothetical protein